MTILILHGITGNSQENWFPWLKSQLEQQDHQVICPDLPNTDHPDRQQWLATIKDLLKDVNHSDLVIVAHSLGVPAALDYIEQSTQPVHALISVSGFYQDYGAELNSFYMSVKNINIQKVKTNCRYFAVLFGDNDPYVPQETLQALANAIKVKPVIFSKGGHLNARAGYTQFPELLKIVHQLTINN